MPRTRSLAGAAAALFALAAGSGCLSGTDSERPDGAAGDAAAVPAAWAEALSNRNLPAYAELLATEPPGFEFTASSPALDIEDSPWLPDGPELLWDRAAELAAVGHLMDPGYETELGTVDVIDAVVKAVTPAETAEGTVLQVDAVIRLISHGGRVTFASPRLAFLVISTSAGPRILRMEEDLMAERPAAAVPWVSLKSLFR